MIRWLLRRHLPATVALMKALRAAGVHDVNADVEAKFKRAWQELGL